MTGSVLDRHLCHMGYWLIPLFALPYFIHLKSKAGLLSIVNISFILIIICLWSVILLKGSEIAHVNVLQPSHFHFTTVQLFCAHESSLFWSHHRLSVKKSSTAQFWYKPHFLSVYFFAAAASVLGSQCTLLIKFFFSFFIFVFTYRYFYFITAIVNITLAALYMVITTFICFA